MGRSLLWKTAALGLALLTCAQSEYAHADPVGCPLNEAVIALQHGAQARSAQIIGQQELPLIHEMEVLTRKGEAHPNQPLAESLSATDLRLFQDARFKMLVLEAQRGFVSGYVRDAKVIEKLADVAEAERNGRTYETNDPDAFYSGLLMLLRLQHPRSDDITPATNQSECSIDTGLFVYEQLAIKEMSRLDLTGVFNRLTAIAKKYGLDMKTKGWANEIPNPTERAKAKTDLNTTARGIGWSTYVNDLENLRFLYHIMSLGYQSDNDDLAQAGDEQGLSKVGTTFDSKLKFQGERAQQLSGVINMIGKRVPSDFAVELKGRIKQLHDAGVGSQ